MNRAYPSMVLITGGREPGGLRSFAEGLAEGFCELGVPAEVVSPSWLLLHWRDLRNSRILKILSTTAVFYAPFARRSISMAHGFPRADAQGWVRLLVILASWKVASRFSHLVAVSHYAAVHLRTIFNLRVDAVIHNPLDPLFLAERELESDGTAAPPRDCITYVGRLHPAKGLDRIFPCMCELVRENEGLRACIIGDGALRGALEKIAGDDPRVEFKGPLSGEQVRFWLRRSRVFVSGCETEALGIAYLEALSQGCAVVMPSTGGGLEIAPQLIGSSIFLFAGGGAREPVLRALRKALDATPAPFPPEDYSARKVALAYLAVDAESAGDEPLLAEAHP